MKRNIFQQKDAEAGPIKFSINQKILTLSAAIVVQMCIRDRGAADSGVGVLLCL